MGDVAVKYYRHVAGALQKITDVTDPAAGFHVQLADKRSPAA